MTLRFYLDEDVSFRLVETLRKAGADAIAVRDVRREGLPDVEQLAYAASEGRVLVTYNRTDFQRLDAEWREAGRGHAGVLWAAERTIPRRDIGGLAAVLQQISDAYDSLADLCLPLTFQ